MNPLESILNEKQVRPTAMRLLVLEYLKEQDAAVGLPEVERKFDHSDKATLYRTLKTFEENGITHSIADGSGTLKYALCYDTCNNHQHHDMHVHFTCTVCHGTFCLPKSKIIMPQLPPKFKAREASLVIKGICKKCN
jgi:Fur family ferric uptake transcriptional regulator